jgi:hypothetical protein
VRPEQLTAESFAGYPPLARAKAEEHLAILRRLPLAFLPLLLRELIVYDWKFPAERVDVDRQFRYLTGLASDSLRAEMAPFAALAVTPKLEKLDWVNAPAVFSEQLSARLWETHQIDAFRKAAVEYVARSSAALPDAPLPVHRIALAVIGQEAMGANYPLFRKLRTHGVYYTRVKADGGVRLLLDTVQARAAAHPQPYAHWYIDGGAALDCGASVTRVSYGGLSEVRAVLQERMRKIYEAPVFDPEAFRTTLAQIKPGEAGLRSEDGTLDRFRLSLLTEGSGTQVFATTFAQWAAREALRRAQPLTLLVRFAPRQREKQMNELLAEHTRPPDLDAAGSLIDADMGAYYTWINQQRLSGAPEAAFLAWYENHSQAFVAGPGFRAGEQSDEPVELSKLIERIA